MHAIVGRPPCQGLSNQPGNIALYSVVAIGLFNSIMFPTIFALSIERLGPLTNKGSSLLIMAIVGGAVVPYLQGVLADHIGVQASFILPLLCYGYIIFYGLVGARTPRPLPIRGKQTRCGCQRNAPR